jgi:hypothetical protein
MRLSIEHCSCLVFRVAHIWRRIHLDKIILGDAMQPVASIFKALVCAIHFLGLGSESSHSGTEIVHDRTQSALSNHDSQEKVLTSSHPSHSMKNPSNFV